MKIYNTDFDSDTKYDMKIYNFKKFVIRLGFSIIVAAFFIIPFFFCQNPTDIIIKDCGGTLTFGAKFLMYLWVLLIEIISCIVVFVLFKGITCFIENKIIKKWFYWICAGEDADKFLKGL